MSISRSQITLLLILGLSNAIILFGPDWLWLRLPAALALTFVLPGWAWLMALNWLHTTDPLERVILVPGVSSVLTALVLFIALFTPGPFTEVPNLIALNLATLTGLAWGMANVRMANKTTTTHPPPIVNRKSKIVNLILLLILVVAIFTRLPRLGYAEFHEDELENMRLIVRAYKGEEYAPFLDSKGPIHWLMPAGLWYLNGWVNEEIARTPFIITALLLIPMIYTLGKRMTGGKESVGLLAAGFVALNGFFVAYARHVENQSLIVFWGALAMWLAYRAYKEKFYPFWLYAALTLAVALIAHPDVLLYLPVFGYVGGLAVWPTFPNLTGLKDLPGLAQQRRLWLWLLAAAALFAALTAVFYIPYLFDPQIGLVFQYFAGDRIGEGLFYNRIDNFFDQDQLYSTRYHAPVLLLLSAWLLARQFAQWRRWGWLILAGLGLACVTTALWPEMWVIANINLAFLPYTLLTLLFILLPQTPVELKILWLWFIVPLACLTFLAKDAADHIQVAYTAWALLAAWALADLWQTTADRRPATPSTVYRLPSTVYRLLRGSIILVLALIIPLILFYQYTAFGLTVTAYEQVKRDSDTNRNSVYNLLYGSIPRPRKIFSNPRLGGWKAPGYALETGQLSGDFRSVNESFAVPVWYTFQTPRSCYDDPQNYWLRRDSDGWPEEEQTVQNAGYTLTGIVLVDQVPTLHLYQKNAPPGEPVVWDSEVVRPLFDRLATPARFAQEDTPAQESAYHFGDKLRLRGFDSPPSTARPGDTLPVTVYWESLAPMDVRYRGFVHLVGPDGAQYGQHDDDPACRLLTTDMRPGQHSSRQFRLPVDPAAPPGEYQVVFGLYHPDTGERLPIYDQTGQMIGDSLVLGTVRVE